jgi:sugar lactone lactonase YvrE
MFLLVAATVAATADCGGDDVSSAKSPGDGGATDVVSPDAPMTSDGNGPGADGGGDSGGDGGGFGDGGNSDPGTFSTVTAVANGAADFFSPFDSTPDPTGQTIYFTAIAAADGTSGIFSVPAAGGTITKIFAGDPLASPLGIAVSADGQQLYVADPAASTANDEGVIFVLPVGGGTPTALGGTDGYAPRSLEVVGSELYFTGVDKNNAQPGVFKTVLSGGAITVVAEGGSLVEPSGVTANAAGDVFFVDALGHGSHAAVMTVPNGSSTATRLVPDLLVGYPAGLALSGDGTALLSSSIDAVKQTDQVLRIELSNGQATASATGPIGSNVEAAGLHRAHNATVYSWADGTAGVTGTIYTLK